MFKLRNKEGPVRFLFQQALHNHHQHRLLMAYLVGCDPCSCNSKAFSQYTSLSSDRSGSSGCCLSFPFLRKLVYDNVFMVNKSIGFTLRGCFDINGHGNNLNFKTKDRAFASLPRPPLLADLEDTAVRDDGRDATLFKVDNRSLNGSPTKPLSIPNHNLSQKIVVAVDVDEVLGNFVSALNRFIADRYLSNYSVSEYHVYEFFKIWNCSRDEADLRVHEFFKTPYFKSGIHPIPGAQTALQKLSRFCSLSVVTSRLNAIKDHTIEWIEKNYPGLFQEIHFGNHFALDGLSRPKSEICRSQRLVGSWVSIQGHRNLVEVLPDRVRELWDKCELRTLVIISIVSQIILLLLGTRRRYRSDVWIKVLVWSAYMTADWVATFAMGVISSNVGDYYHKNGEEEKDINPQLIAFWAPFFLIHLGGPETITAYALEDNELWLRHLVTLVAQTLTTTYIIALSWEKTSWLSYLSIPMLIIGIIKYGERIWCLYSASMSHLRDSLMRIADRGPDIDSDPGIVSFPSRESLFDFMGLFISLFTDVVLSPRQLSLKRERFQNHNSSYAFYRISNELEFTYNVLYTKQFVADSIVGRLSRWITFLGTVIVLVVYIAFIGSNKHSLVDRVITHVLLIYAVISDYISFILNDVTPLCCEPCPVDMFPRCPFVLCTLCMIELIYPVTGERPFENHVRLEPCDFLTLIWNEEVKVCGNSFLSVKKFEWLHRNVQNQNVTHCDVSEDLQEMIFTYYQNKSKSNLSGILGSGYRDIISSKLRIQVSPSSLEFHKTIIVWHIATDLFYYSQQQSDHQQYPSREETKNLSDYKLFLLIKRRYMLPVGTGLNTMRDTLNEARKLFPQKPENSSVPQVANIILDQFHTLTETESTNEGVFVDACEIAKELLTPDRNREQMWTLLGELWIEILGYAAAHCTVNNHAQQLRRGREFLTQVWLLQANLGLLEQFHDIIIPEENPEIPSNSSAPQPQHQRSPPTQ